MPDTPLPNPETDDEVESQLLAAAIRAADADPVRIPHEEIRAWLVGRIAELQSRIDAPNAE